MTYAEAVAEALKLAGKAGVAAKAVDPVVTKIAAAAMDLARKRGVDLSTFLNGDPIHDRTVLNIAEVNAEIKSGFNWAGVPSTVVEVGVAVAKAAMILASLV